MTMTKWGYYGGGQGEPGSIQAAADAEQQLREGSSRAGHWEFPEPTTSPASARPELPPNPKQAYGDKKVPLHLVPASSIIYEALAFKEGARKYGPYNWREKAVEAETYVGAAMRHLVAWHDGEEIDPESNVHHLGLAKACLGILIDAMVTENLIDNRPPQSWTGELIRKFTAS